MSTKLNDRLFSPYFLPLKLAAAIYVLAIPLAHGLLPETLVWAIAAVFLYLMLPPYPFTARGSAHWQTETRVALGLAALCTAGLLLSPLLIIAAIFLHGCWDLAKHKGHGVPFFGWYVSGCVIVDWLYSAALLRYYLQGGHA